MRRSEYEFEMIKQVVKKSDPLPYPLLTHKDDTYDDELYYDIPDAEKETVLKRLWFFTSDIEMSTVLHDIHAGQDVEFGNCIVVRRDGIDYICSPMYWESGGTIIDLLQRRDEAISILFVK